MEAELENRWEEAERQKNITPDELKVVVQEMEAGITIPENWNRRCEESIRNEKKEIGKRYGIRFGQTETYCVRCGRPCWPGNHTCRDIRREQIRKGKVGQDGKGTDANKNDPGGDDYGRRVNVNPRDLQARRARVFTNRKTYALR